MQNSVLYTRGEWVTKAKKKKKRERIVVFKITESPV